MSSSGPFGLWMGMTANDFSLPLEEVSSCKFWAPEVPKPHSAFSRYVVVITPARGLSWIKAVGRDISTSGYGIEVQSAFEGMEAKLANAYGKSKKIDLLMHDSIWNEPRDWMQGLLNNERFLMAEWSKDTGATLANSLASVALVVGVNDTSTGYIAIEYSFENFADAEAEIAAMEDDAL
jgi:hypothetical protein